MSDGDSGSTELVKGTPIRENIPQVLRIVVDARDVAIELHTTMAKAEAGVRRLKALRTTSEAGLGDAIRDEEMGLLTEIHRAESLLKSLHEDIEWFWRETHGYRRCAYTLEETTKLIEGWQGGTCERYRPGAVCGPYPVREVD